ADAARGRPRPRGPLLHERGLPRRRAGIHRKAPPRLEGQVIYFHEEQRFGPWVWAVLAIIAVPVSIAAIGLAGRDPAAVAAILVGPAVVALIIVLFALAKLVTDVDARGIHVTFHFLWPTRDIP